MINCSTPPINQGALVTNARVEISWASNNEAATTLPGRQEQGYGFACGDEIGEVAGASGLALPARKTPAPDSALGRSPATVSRLLPLEKFVVS